MGDEILLGLLLGVKWEVTTASLLVFMFELDVSSEVRVRRTLSDMNLGQLKLRTMEKSQE